MPTSSARECVCCDRGRSAQPLSPGGDHDRAGGDHLGGGGVVGVRNSHLALLLIGVTPLAVCAETDVPSRPQGFYLESGYFQNLKVDLSIKKADLEKAFSRDLMIKYSVCLVEYFGQSDCSDFAHPIVGFDLPYSSCKDVEREDLSGDLQLCETLIERRRDGERMACARMVGWTPLSHGQSRTSSHPMHFDAQGNWRLGQDPIEVEKYRRALEEDPFRPARSPSLYSNMHCTSDVADFFELN